MRRRVRLGQAERCAAWLGHQVDQVACNRRPGLGCQRLGQDFAGQGFNDVRHLASRFEVGTMVAAGQDHLLATRHDGGKRVQALTEMRRAAFPAQEHHRGPDLGIDVQAQSQSVEIGDLAPGPGSASWG